MSIKELVAKIKSGEVKSYDVVKSYVDTINKKEDKIDAFLLLKTDEALQKAKEIDELKSKLQNNEISFKDLTKDRKDVIQSNTFKINNAGYISGLGYNDVLAKTILDAPSNKVESFTAEDKIYIFNKVEDIKYKKAKYEDVKDRVREDYLNSKTQEEIKKYI